MVNGCKHMFDGAASDLREPLSDHLEHIISLSTAPEWIGARESFPIPSRVCITCNTQCGSPLACVECVAFTCSTAHFLAHAETAGHQFALRIPCGPLYCVACKDFVYSAKVDSVISRAAGDTIVVRKGGEAGGGGGTKRRLKEVSSRFVWQQARTWRQCMGERTSPLPPVVTPESLATIGLKGMTNLGNTCFMSSVLQSIIRLPPFRDFFLKDGHNQSQCRRARLEALTNPPPGHSAQEFQNCLACEIDSLLTSVFATPGVVLCPHTFLFSVWSCAQNLAGYAQQDAHEFLISLLNLLHGHLLRADPTLTAPPPGANPHHDGPSCPCIVHQVFEGEMRSQLKCLGCHHVSSQVEHFLDLSLTLPHSSTQPTRPASVKECLNRFTHPERLGAGEKVKCSHCNEYEEFEKQFVITRLPDVLCLHVKRFRQDDSYSARSTKISDFIEFPVVFLDMSPYVLQVPSGEASQAHSTHPGPSIHPPSSQPAAPISHLYELVAVVNHFGTLSSGHYVAHVRAGKQWFRCDDATVSEAAVEDVLSSEGYVLFYMRSAPK